MATLRQVLTHFEGQSGAVSLAVMAKELGVERPLLQEMIDFWVRKGRLREVGTDSCNTCGCAHGCPFVFELPRSYELVTEESISSPAPACPHCARR
jgi:hypothetical protein